MSFYRKVKASQSISRKTVCPSLQKYSLGPEVLDDLGDDRLEDHFKGLIIKAFVQWEVDCVVCS